MDKKLNLNKTGNVYHNAYNYFSSVVSFADPLQRLNREKTRKL